MRELRDMEVRERPKNVQNESTAITPQANPQLDNELEAVEAPLDADELLQMDVEPMVAATDLQRCDRRIGSSSG